MNFSQRPLEMNFLPFSRFEVRGNSMLPSLKEGDRVLLLKTSIAKEGDVVAAKIPGTGIVLKRVRGVSANGYCLFGDNPSESTDSRHYGAVKKENILGKMVFRY